MPPVRIDFMQHSLSHSFPKTAWAELLAELLIGLLIPLALHGRSCELHNFRSASHTTTMAIFIMTNSSTSFIHRAGIYALSTLGLLLMSGSSARATTVTSVSCASYFGASTGLANCDASGPVQENSASALGNVSATLTMPTNASDYLVGTISSYLSAGCGGAPFPSLCYPASANATANINVQLATAGPARQGYIEITRPLNQWVGSAGVFSGTWSVSIGSLTGSCFTVGPNGNCSEIADPFYVDHFGPTLPFELGVPFTFDESFTAGAYSDVTSGGSAGIVQEGLGFRLVEADGTAVPIETTPEPASLALVALPAFLMVCFRKRFSRAL